jgi:hypothetical protein
MRGFSGRITIWNEIHYWMEFSLEQLQELCAVACHLHKPSATNSARPNKVPYGNGNKQGKADATGKA